MYSINVRDADTMSRPAVIQMPVVNVSCNVCNRNLGQKFVSSLQFFYASLFCFGRLFTSSVCIPWIRLTWFCLALIIFRLRVYHLTLSSRKGSLCSIRKFFFLNYWTSLKLLQQKPRVGFEWKCLVQEPNAVLEWNSGGLCRHKTASWGQLIPMKGNLQKNSSQ